MQRAVPYAGTARVHVASDARPLVPAAMSENLRLFLMTFTAGFVAFSALIA